MKHVDPLSNFFLFEAPPADGSTIGRHFAERMVRVLKSTCVSARDPFVLRGYLKAWNERGGSPFTPDELETLSKLEPEQKIKPRRPPEPEAFAIRLLEEPR